MYLHKRGFVLLLRRGVIERSFAWMTRCPRLAKDDERLPEVGTGLHVLAFVSLTLIPTLAFYLFAERHIVTGLTAGAVKG